MGRNRVRVSAVVLATGLLLSGCAFTPVIPVESDASSPRPSSPRPSDSPTPRPSPSASGESVPEGADAGEDGHDDGEHAAHPPADPSLTAATAYAFCVSAGRASLFTDDPAATWQPLGGSYVQRVDNVWRVHSGVTTTSADGASGGASAYCQVTGSESAPVVLTVGVTLAPPDDPGLWALPEG